MKQAESSQDGLFKKNGVNYLLSFLMITICFALWGFANDVTNPLVSSFGKIFQINKFQSSFVQVAFYLGYFCMAFPAAIFIQRYSFKSGVLLGLLLYAVGALAFVPAKSTGIFYAFLPAYFVMTADCRSLRPVVTHISIAWGLTRRPRADSIWPSRSIPSGPSREPISRSPTSRRASIPPTTRLGPPSLSPTPHASRPSRSTTSAFLCNPISTSASSSSSFS